MSEGELKEGLEHTGADTDKIAARGRKRTTLATIMGVKAKRKKGDQGDMEVDSDDDMDVDMNENKTLQEKLRDKKLEFLKGRMSGSNPLEHSQKESIKKEEGERMRKKIEKTLRRSESSHFSDRRQTAKMPKHLFAGKRKMGKTDRR